MRSSSFKIRWCWLLAFGLGLPLALYAQTGEYVSLSGEVRDAGTGAPLEGAHVFVAGSTFGTATAAGGRFLLDRVPLGGHRFYVSMVGYDPVKRDTLLVHGGSLTLTFRLEPTVIQLAGVTVEAEPNRRWRKRLKKFNRLFVGESDYARKTEILNPEVLDFESDRKGLHATASAPLVIENLALGYRIRYFLKEFHATGTRIKYDGEPLFEEMQPESPKQAAMWEENRRRAFYGSFRHFLLAVLAGQTQEEGFLTFSRASLDEPTGSEPRFRLDPDKLLVPSTYPSLRTLDFHGFVEIVYTDEVESDAFIHWHYRGYQRPGNQRSFVELNRGPTLVDHTGTVLDPYGITLFGYFAFERVADEVPKNYRPENAQARLPVKD